MQAAGTSVVHGTAGVALVGEVRCRDQAAVPRPRNRFADGGSCKLVSRFEAGCQAELQHPIWFELQVFRVHCRLHYHKELAADRHLVEEVGDAPLKTH